MPWVRRTRHLALSAADDDPLVVIRSLLTGTCVSLEPPELAALLALPIRSWRWREEGDPWAEERYGRPDPVRMRRGPRK